MFVDHFRFARGPSSQGQQVNESVGGTLPGGFAGKVLSCQVSVLLKRSHFEIFPMAMPFLCNTWSSS